MRILHTSDWHLGKNLDGHSRMDEQEQFLEDLVTIVEKNNIDMIVIAGDVYDSVNPPARAEKMFYNTLKRLSNYGERLILVVAGNHDNPEGLVAAGPLAMEHGIIMIGTPKTVIQTGDYGRHRVLRSNEGFIEIEINNEKAVILTIPYLSEKRLNEVLYDNMDEDNEKASSYSDRIKSLFSDLSSNFREDSINLVVSHLFTMGSEEGGSERSIQLGGSYIVDGSCFPSNAQYIFLGHVHKPQLVPNTHGKARYSGSPLHYNKKEIAYDKKCFIVDVHKEQEAIVEEVKLNVYKPIEIWKCNSMSEALKMCEDNQARECWVYLEIKTDNYIREDEIKALKGLKRDILEILPIINTGKNEAEELTSLSEKSFEDVFRTFYKRERGIDADNEIVDMFLSIIARGEDNNETD